MDTTRIIKDLAQYAGPIALAAFMGTFLGGVVLSFFWKNFGPWQLLKEANKALAECRIHREEDGRERARQMAEFADLKARFMLMTDAVNLAGLGLRIGVMPLENHVPILAQQGATTTKGDE